MKGYPHQNLESPSSRLEDWGRGKEGRRNLLCGRAEPTWVFHLASASYLCASQGSPDKQRQ